MFTKIVLLSFIGLSGGVSFEEVDGELRGVIGQGKAIGAFHGNDADLIYSGGFLTYRR